MSRAWQLLYINSRLPKFLTPATFFWLSLPWSHPAESLANHTFWPKTFNQKECRPSKLLRKLTAFPIVLRQVKELPVRWTFIHFDEASTPKVNRLEFRECRLLRCVFEGIYMFIFGFSCAYHKSQDPFVGEKSGKLSISSDLSSFFTDLLPTTWQKKPEKTIVPNPAFFRRDIYFFFGEIPTFQSDGQRYPSRTVSPGACHLVPPQPIHLRNSHVHPRDGDNGDTRFRVVHWLASLLDFFVFSNMGPSSTLGFRSLLGDQGSYKSYLQLETAI